MSDIGDLSSRRPRPQGRPRRVQVLLASAFGLVTVIVALFRSAAVFFTDYLWFDSVDFTDVWSGLLTTKVALGLASVLVFAALLWLNLWYVDRRAPRLLGRAPEDEMARRWQLAVRPRAGRVRTLIAFSLALFGGLGFSNSWQEWLLFRHGGDFGRDDPQFGMDVGFFVFRLPFLTTVVDWLFSALIFTILVSLVAHYLAGAIRPQASSNRLTSAVKTHVSLLLGLLALVRAAQYVLERYELSFSQRGVVTGANYTDVNIMLPALVLLAAISVLAAIVFFVTARSRGWQAPVITVGSWALVSLLIGTAIPVAVQSLSVAPAESQKETPFIERNITATRAALGLDAVRVHDFPYTDELTSTDLSNNAQTVRNIRLWDPALLEPSYQRLQENRSFFRFDDIDVDRYEIDGQQTQVELSVRELNTAGLPQDRRSWVNQHLQYTHGYGAVASPSNAVTRDGSPAFSLRDVPPQGTPEITKPQVYFGERPLGAYSVVNTEQAEVDYVAVSGRDETSHYEGSGGVVLSNLVRRAAFAARVGDLGPLISDLVTDESRAVYLSNIRERAEKAAPFLAFDHDPYAVIIDGRIQWVHDAYTTSATYPNAQVADTSLLQAASGLRNRTFNYVRNSVKVVTDAYDGTMRFYVVDEGDPVVRAWRSAFPDLFVDGSTMPAGVREHVRYPEDLFQVQTAMYGSYHLTDATQFYGRSDRWNIAQKPRFGTMSGAGVTPTIAPAPGGGLGGSVAPAASAGEQRIEPYYLLMRLPGEPEESFVAFQPFVPFSTGDQRKELSAFMTVKSDPSAYGQLDAYVMPRDQQIDGPALVEARIQQEPSISQQITLLNQSGSEVQLGNMLIIPIEDSLLYVRPLYVTSRQTRVPEFKKAIVVQGDRIAMEDTLQAALAKVFGAAPATLEETRAPANAGGASTPPAPPAPGASGAIPASTPTPPADAAGLLDQANAAFTRADEALRAGDLGRYQSEVRAGIDLVRRARGG